MLRYFLQIYLLAIACFSTFRLLILWTMWHHVAALPPDENFGLIAKSLLMGFRFDTVISCYLLALPLLLVGLKEVSGLSSKWLVSVIPLFVSLFFVLAFFICAADIPYFAQGFGRLNAWSVEWGDNRDFVIGMVLEEFRYWWPVIPFVIISTVFVIFAFSWKKHLNANDSGKTFFARFVIPLVLLFICFIGIRGRIAFKSPIRVGTAYFSNHAFPNELGLNPVFTFIRSYLDRQKTENLPLSLMDDTKALEYVRQYLGADGPDNKSIERQVVGSDTLPKRNVVIVIMESMSAAKTGFLGGSSLTPVLDSLSLLSLNYTKAYTAGIHTYNGIFSTLFSWPSIGMRHPMKNSNMLQYNGIASTLSASGYASAFFTTHDPQFDNVAGFLASNGFEKIIAQPDYPSERILSTLGVPDDFMFSFSMDYLDQMQEPFLATYMTASDHGPYIVPDYFEPNSTGIKQAAVEYADWSIGRFLDMARSKPWFENTLFVFVADHGAAMDYDTEMPLSYHHTPLIFHAPKFVVPKTQDCLALQTDIFPTVADLLGITYINNTFGQSLLTDSDRTMIGFSADERIGVLHSSGLYLILRQDGTHTLHELSKSGTNAIEPSQVAPSRIDSMLTHARAIPQSADYLIRLKKTNR